MFGYIRPLKGELKVREYELYRAAYCGLCHTLRRRCGFSAQFVINYDFTFLAMLLSETQDLEYNACRCIANPHRKKQCVAGGKPFDTAADYSLILAYSKLKDTMADETGMAKWKACCATGFLGNAYKNARKQAPIFDAVVAQKLQELGQLEQVQSGSIDAVAHCFSSILECIAEVSAAPERQRILKQIFYHTGRIIYILDAVDDLPEDCIQNAYNPLRERFPVTNGVLLPEDATILRNSLQHSHNMLASAFALLEPGAYYGILNNIIHLGIPWVVECVFRGTWKQRGVHSSVGKLHQCLGQDVPNLQ